MSAVDVDSGVYTIPEAARRWGISTRTLYRRIETGTCPVAPVRIGSSIRLPKHLVEAVIAGEFFDEATKR